MEEVIRQAALALGSSYYLMEDYNFQKRLGWHTYWDPDIVIARAAKNVKSLIWC
jgi:hypothetical protein